MSSIQQGIQTAHLVGELQNKFNDDPLFDQWCKKDKTIIVCNGGMARDILDSYRELLELNLQLPIASFQEEAGALDIKGSASITSFGIIVPEYIYDAVNLTELNYSWQSVDTNTNRSFCTGSRDEILYTYIKSRSLAR